MRWRRRGARCTGSSDRQAEVRTTRRGSFATLQPPGTLTEGSWNPRQPGEGFGLFAIMAEMEEDIVTGEQDSNARAEDHPESLDGLSTRALVDRMVAAGEW